MELDGKVALVTGAGSGIGRAIALRFAAAADVANPEDVDAMYAEIDERFGGLDVLVNNAGIAEGAPGELDHVGELAERMMAEAAAGGPLSTRWDVLERITDAPWHRMIAVHLSGTFFNLRAAVPRMAGRGGGAIVNISSAA